MTTIILCNDVESEIIRPTTFSFSRLSSQKFGVLEIPYEFLYFCRKHFFFFLDFDKYCRQWHPTPVLLPGKSHGWRSLVGCSPWGHEDSDTTEQFHFQFSLLCIREGNDNSLQYSCLENPRDGGAWWAAIYGVAQSRTRLKRLSSSSSSTESGGHLWSY